MKPVVAIIQARMGASRLPGKVMMEIEGKPMLQHVVERVKVSQGVDICIVATSLAPADQEIENWCLKNQTECFRGSEIDVLDRYLGAAEKMAAKTVIRITSDCPLIDPEIIEKSIRTFSEQKPDYLTNGLRYTYPDGMDVEVFTMKALRSAHEKATKPSEREHVTPYLRNSREFQIVNFENEIDLGPRNLRLTVDQVEDLEFVREIARQLKHLGQFGLSAILELLDSGTIETKRAAMTNEGYYKSLYQEAAIGSAQRRNVTRSLEYFEKAKKLIPGAAQTFSKGYTQHIPGISPLFLEKGKGSHVWDVDGNEYIDFIQGLLPNILGYACDEVDDAFRARAGQGHSFSLSHPLELELAEKLIEIIPCAEMVRYGKNGSDATAGSVRIARAATGRKRVACCGYHGWQDWYIGSTTRHAGVPDEVRALTHPFVYNDLESLKKILTAHPGDFAAVIMEPMNFVEPQKGFLEGVQALAKEHGAILIFDEICSGFHFGLGGAQKHFGVTPDMACFGKAMGNGYPISAVVGRRDLMKICEEVFFSFTFGGEVASMAAALKVIEILEKTDAYAKIRANGQRLQEFNSLSNFAGLSDVFSCVGIPTWSLVKIQSRTKGDGLLERSLYQQEMVKRGILALLTHNLTATHTELDIEKTLHVQASVLKTLGVWLQDEKPERFLEGPKIEAVFKVR